METIIPFSTLPACASQCGALFDANGACAPIGVTSAPSAIASCFCANAKVTAFSTGTSGVCDNACTANPADYGSIRAWFTSYCANPATITAAPRGATATSTPLAGQDPNTGDWLSTHWQWVVMIVILVVGICAIWIGACVWRRRYLRKKDRQYSLGKQLGDAGVGANAVPREQGADAANNTGRLPAAGMFEPAPIAAAGYYGPDPEKEKKVKKKWNPTQRT